MRRLNEVARILSDPGLRLQYDVSINGSTPAKAATPVSSPAARRSGNPARAMWMAAAALLAVGAGWYLTSGAERAESGKPIAGFSDSRPSQHLSELAAAHARLASVEAERDRALEALARLRAQRADPAHSGAPEDDRSPTSVMATLPEPYGASSPAPASGSLTGLWYYAQPPAGRSALVPEAIELLLIESRGRLRGRYHARYPAAEVLFVFEGRPKGPVQQMQWIDSQGARGQVRLRLLAENSLQVEWFATSGGNPRVASGAAVLARRVRPNSAP